MTELDYGADTSVVNLLTDAIVAVLVQGMIEVVPDSTSVGLARSGKLQADPTIAKLNLLVREGGSDWPDILIPANYPLYAPQYEMPAGNTWLRRLRADYTLFFLGINDRNTARIRANVVFSRFKYLIAKMGAGYGLDGLTDSFDETVIMGQINRLETFEEGGPGEFIWKGTHYFEFVTEQLLE